MKQIMLRTGAPILNMLTLAQDAPFITRNPKHYSANCGCFCGKPCSRFTYKDTMGAQPVCITGRACTNTD